MKEKKPSSFSNQRRSSTAMPEFTETSKMLFHEEEAGLSLNVVDSDFKPKTRSKLYTELEEKEQKVTQDYFELPNPILRGLALLIDIMFTYLLILLAFMAAPFLLSALHWGLEKQGLSLGLSDELMMQILQGLDVFFALFFFVVIPVAFFNTSLGKKVTKLRVRGEDNYTLHISQAFKREIILKPLGMVCLVGFILPFFDKKRRSLHDRMAGTFVIKD